MQKLFWFGLTQSGRFKDMPISLKGLSSGGNAIHQERLTLKSGTFVAPIDAVYLVTAIGAGASGALTPATGNGLCATGGGAGGKAAKKVQLTKGQALTIVIGAGGAKCTVPGTNGNDGGTTTVTGPGIALTANGGQGGRTRAAGAGTAAGAIGGTATGGDENLQGGGSGSATVATIASCVALTGGGAVAIYEVGYASGNASSSAGVVAYSSGAGVGGRSGSATATSANTLSMPSSALRESPQSTNNNSSYLENTLAEFPYGYDGLPSGLASASSSADRTYQARILSPKSGVANSISGALPPGCGSLPLRGGQQQRAGLFAGAGPRDFSGGGGYLNGSVCGGGTGGATTDFANEAGSGCVVIEWFEEFK